MSVFVIPMAGLSSRFFNEGFHVPKYQLIIDNVSMFSWSVLSFKKYFKEDYFLFICRDVFDTPNFIKSEIKKLGISNYNIIILGDKTKGQGDTVNRGLLQSEILSSILDENLFIFNIDSKLLDFSKPSFLSECSGYLEVFKEKGEHWSFVVPNGPKKVYRTTEKERVSDFCSDGLTDRPAAGTAISLRAASARNPGSHLLLRTP